MGTIISSSRGIYLSRSTTNQQNNVHPAKTPISLGIRPDRSESSLCAQWIVKEPMFFHADSGGSDQTGRMHMLI